MFISGMAINIHSDHILRCLRKPGETSYKIPRGKKKNMVRPATKYRKLNNTWPSRLQYTEINWGKKIWQKTGYKIPRVRKPGKTGYKTPWVRKPGETGYKTPWVRNPGKGSPRPKWLASLTENHLLFTSRCSSPVDVKLFYIRNNWLVRRKERQ